MLAALLEMWRTHDEINLYLLRHIPDDGFRACTLLKNGQPSKGRNVTHFSAHARGKTAACGPGIFARHSTFRR